MQGETHVHLLSVYGPRWLLSNCGRLNLCASSDWLKKAKAVSCTADCSVLLFQGKKWNWYLRYLYGQGLEGLKLFIESSINRVSKASQSKPEDEKV